MGSKGRDYRLSGHARVLEARGTGCKHVSCQFKGCVERWHATCYASRDVRARAKCL